MLRPINGKRLIETGKNVLIILLAASALFLGKESGLLTQISSLFDRDGFIGEASRQEENSETDSDTGSFGQAAVPLAMAVTGIDGVRRGAKYGEVVDYLYSRFNMNLGEALGSSGEPEELSAAEWEEALRSPGIYFDFQFDQKLSVLSGWLSGKKTIANQESHGARRLCLAKDGEGMSLYYMESSSGGFFRCETALSFSESIERSLGESQGSTVKFAFESLGGNFGIDPYFLFIEKMPDIYAVEPTSILREREIAQTLLSAFGMNIYIQPSISADGGVEYAENDARLKIAEGGKVIFRGERLKIPGDGNSPTAGEIVEACRIIIQECAADLGGDAFLSLSGLTYKPDGANYTVRFDYILGGIPVRLDETDSAVVIDVAGGIIKSAVMYLRAYSLSNEPLLVLPEAQEAGIVTASGGGEPVLIYQDNGDTVNARWIIDKAGE